MTLEHAVKELEYALSDNARMTVPGSHFYGVSRNALETILDIAKQRLMRIDPDPKLMRYDTPRLGMVSFDELYANLMVEVEATNQMRQKLYAAEARLETCEITFENLRRAKVEINVCDKSINGLMRELTASRCSNEQLEILMAESEADKRRMDWLCSRACSAIDWECFLNVKPENLRGAIDERMQSQKKSNQ